MTTREKEIKRLTTLTGEEATGCEATFRCFKSPPVGVVSKKGRTLSLHRRNPRRDANEGLVIDVLTAHGFHVTRISGAGVPDLLVSHRAHGGRCWVVEVKTPKGRSKAAQIAFGQQWQGEPIAILRSADDAILWAQARR